MQKSLINLILIFSLGIGISCNRKPIENKSKVISVSILPYKYFVERIVGDKYIVNVMVPPGSSPENYEITPQNVEMLANSTVYYKVGLLEFEKTLLDKALSVNKQVKVIDLSKNTNIIGSTDEHKHESGHSHVGGYDPHVWESPTEVKKIILSITQSISAIDTINKGFYYDNYSSFVKDIEKIDSLIIQKTALLSSKKFIIYHPALAYFARDYGLEQHCIEVDGKSPSPKDIKSIIDLAKAEKIRIIFVQSQFDTHNSELIAREANAEVVQIDPLAYNWLKHLQILAETLTKVVK